MEDDIHSVPDEVEQYDKSIYSDYRSKWEREKEVTEVDMDNHVVPQYAKHFPSAGEYPEEVYDACDCLSVEVVRENLSVGDTVLFWNGPPCNPNAYVHDGVVRELPPIDYARPGKSSIRSNDHFTTGSDNGESMRRASGGLFGEMRSDVRVDCVIAINPEE